VLDKDHVGSGGSSRSSALVRMRYRTRGRCWDISWIEGLYICCPNFPAEFEYKYN